ncbi:MAG: FHA domain-containing protein [Mariniblastus sp.]|nr:FHA domain-containing protein [Mariniblastus sp.]
MRIQLTLTDSNANTRQFKLDETGSTFVGKGPNCRIEVQGADVQEMHCFFWINEQNDLMIQDWNTGNTLVNGRVISEECRLKAGDKIKIGPNTIVPSMTSGPDNETSLEPHSESISPDKATQVSPPVARNATSEAAPPKFETTQFGDTGEAGDKFVYDINANEDDEATTDDDVDFGFSTGFSNSDFEITGPLDAEQAQILRMEVEQLRFELAERNAQVMALSESSQATNPVDEEQTLKLVNRLEELLQELQSSDDRVRGLEDLLRCSDEATLAEREERQQLESWVSEIEQRLLQREAESEAEMGRVVKRLHESKSRFKEAETQLEKVLQSNEGALNEHSSELIRSLSDQLSQLQDNLDSVNQENDSLRKASNHRQIDPEVQGSIHELEQKLMESQVASSQERAELARQRADLQRLQDELQQKLAGTQMATNSADLRIEAMRQHLREIHNEEKLEKEEKRRKSLSGRIANLLSRSSR